MWAVKVPVAFAPRRRTAAAERQEEAVGGHSASGAPASDPC